MASVASSTYRQLLITAVLVGLAVVVLNQLEQGDALVGSFI
jgi:hypothetical protein